MLRSHYLLDELNIYLTFPAAGTDPPDLAHVTYRPYILLKLLLPLILPVLTELLNYY
jgi:hypothetical protein